MYITYRVQSVDYRYSFQSHFFCYYQYIIVGSKTMGLLCPVHSSWSNLLRTCFREKDGPHVYNIVVHSMTHMHYKIFVSTPSSKISMCLLIFDYIKRVLTGSLSYRGTSESLGRLNKRTVYLNGNYL